VREPLELEWLGGAAQRRFRRRRPEIDDLPWGELARRDRDPAVVDRARIAWTRNVIGEYAGAACFAATSQALLAARAPIDLVAMASDFVVDELAHVELAARIAMGLGGAAPVEVDLAALVPALDPGLTPRQRASELVVRVSCVTETYNVASLFVGRAPARNPLLRAAHDLLLRDEAQHARMGWLYLDWIGDALDAPERARLAAAADDQMATILAAAPDEHGRREARRLLDAHVVARLPW
jgi:hypothetical protein